VQHQEIRLLTNHRYVDKALRELSQALGSAVSRAHIFITARVSEYLTAQWLLHLLESGKSWHAVEGLLFTHRYGLDVVVPSMRPMAAWLALWDDRIRDRILTTAPEILIEHGDPSRLPVDIRSRLLEQFASLDGGGSDIGASFDIASVRTNDLGIE
jgi:hypothetical protein